MEVQVYNYSYYKEHFDFIKQELIGTQTIFSVQLQEALILSFIDTEDDNQLFVPEALAENMRQYAFSLNNISLHPTLVCNECPKNYIFVSNEIYEQFFKENNKMTLHFYYNLPKVKSILLKRESGNFPKDDSLEMLLTMYFEQCMFVNLNQKFKIDYGEDTIEFSISKVQFIKEPKKIIQDRFDEINITVKFNQYITETETLGLGMCKSLIQNYSWYYTNNLEHFICGDVSFTNVEIDFEITEEIKEHKITDLPPRIRRQIQEEQKLREQKEEEEKLNKFKIGTVQKEQEPEEQLTPEQLRLKRLSFFKK
jgi:hypothetical protein